MTSAEAAHRAAQAEASVLARPWPRRPLNYWWRAHLLDCLVDAELRDPDARRRRMIARFPRWLWARNGLRWLNDYYDDIAWFGLALERASRIGYGNRRALGRILARLESGWNDDELGGLAWRRHDDFRNAPANGPAAILFARTGKEALAKRLVDWMLGTLQRDDGLVIDGIRPRRREEALYTYCQGVVIGALVELGRLEEAERVVEGIEAQLTTDGVLNGQGGGDGGLFAGITARYLTEAALVGSERAGRIVEASAEAAWRNRGSVGDRVVFGRDWAAPAELPRDDELSVQLSGWMLLEAAARLSRGAQTER